MGHSYSQPVVKEEVEIDTSIRSTPNNKIEREIPEEQEYIYLLVHNHTICSYIDDESQIDSTVRSYMRRIFKKYIQSWNAYQYSVIQKEPLDVQSNSVVRSVTLISRAIHLLGQYEQVEEEIEVIRVSRYTSTTEEELEENESECHSSECDSESESSEEEEVSPIPDKEE